MSYKVDKKHPITLGDVCKQWPEELQPGDYGYRPLYKLNQSAYGVNEVLGKDGMHVVGGYNGVTAVFVGSTENGEYEGVYVTYGTFITDKNTQYYPVIEYKRKGKRSAAKWYTNEIPRDVWNSSNEYMQTGDVLKVLRGAYLVDLGGKRRKPEEVTRMIYHAGHYYFTYAELISSAMWYTLETYEY